jgi:hypothetical protein
MVEVNRLYRITLPAELAQHKIDQHQKTRFNLRHRQAARRLNPTGGALSRPALLFFITRSGA